MSSMLTTDYRLIKMLTATVNHNAGMVRRPRLLDRFGSGANMLGCVIGTLSATTEDDVNILVSSCLDDSGKTLFGHAHESVRVRGGPHCVNSNIDTVPR